MEKKSNRQELNNEQKKAAFCTENAVVAAGAGSGKTMVLANRFVWLLTEKGYKVDEILTLTFTKKAAAQMFKRIYSLLSEIAETETGNKAKIAQKALDDFIHARIQTLDSYASSLVKQCAPQYGISPDFRIDQERCYDLALKISYPFLITNRHHPAVERLYSTSSQSGIARNIFAHVLVNYCNIDKPVDFEASLKKQFCLICEEWKIHREKIITILKELEKQICENNSLLPVLVPVIEKNKKGQIEIPDSFEIQAYLDQLTNTHSENCIEEAETHPVQKSIVTFLYFLNSICSLSLRGGKRSENPVKENIKQLRLLFDTFFSLAISCMQAGFNLSFMPLLTELQSQYLFKKRAEAILTFHDVAYLARTILAEQTAVRQSEKESFKAIMIDEFQDNNDLQKDTLFLLAEKMEIINSGVPSAEDLSPGKLFFVGDEKQSIYLFRGADVSVFRKLKDELKTADLSLKTNYRSAPKLIGAFNSIFGGSAFEPEEKPSSPCATAVFAPSQSLPLFEASYTFLEAGSAGNGSLSICVFNKKRLKEQDDEDEERLSADENEARFVAEKIKKLLDEKKYCGNDIAVLFRTRSSQYLFEKHLRLLDIPYAAEDINDLFYAGPVNDILSVLQLTSHPFDNTAYAQMLRSPFAGLSLSGTAVCLSIFREEAAQPFIDEPLQYLDENDREKYLCGRKAYESIYEKSGNESISSLVSELWYNEGYRYETQWNPQTSVYSELYDYLFHLAVKADAENKTLASFTDWLCSFRDSGGRLSETEIPLERHDAVHIMTIHKSKGLEFPVVFLCGCGKRSQADKIDTVYFSNEAGIVLSPPVPYACRRISGKRNNFFWQRSNDENKQKRTAELRRLFYVGMTRAEKELYITGSLEVKYSDETEDFSLALKKHIKEKCAENENIIPGDSILDNDTFFGLLLPSIVQHIPADGLKDGSSFFDLEEIPAYTEDYLKKHEAKKANLTNDRHGLKEYIKTIETVYQNAEIIKTPAIYDNHITPVSLRNKEKKEQINIFADKKFAANNEYSGESADDVFIKVDAILSHYSQTDDKNSRIINPASFGTIAHICVEANLNKETPVIPANFVSSLKTPEIDTLLEAGKELACRFVNSPLGKLAKNSSGRENEFPFRSILKNNEGKEIFINGTIDLFFEDKNSIHIVDFKTDSNEMPSEHIIQLACYFHAVSSLSVLPEKKECRVWLYYLRTGHAIEITDSVVNLDIKKTVFF